MKFARTLFLFLLLLVIENPSKAQTIPSWKATELKKFIDNSDSILVINFWATFCKPCIEELPYFQTIIDKYKDRKVKFLMVSLDLSESYPDKIAEFAKQQNYKADIVWLNETNADYFCPMVDKHWYGSIPSTYFVNLKTGYRHFVEQEMKPERFEAELLKAL